MITIEAENLGKKFLRRYVFRNFNYHFSDNGTYAVVGSNGSGKSTLLQILCGYMMPNEGKVIFNLGNKKIDEEEHFKYCSITSPFLELIEEYTVAEHIRFHAQLRPMLLEETEAVSENFQLGSELNKQIKYLSSGNKQRIKLALAFCTNSQILLLDEPTQNLDSRGIDLYLQAIEKFTLNRMVIVSSNDTREYSFCKEIIKIEAYK
jgi:ABC-type multidrug transport system ATPase subunit